MGDPQGYTAKSDYRQPRWQAGLTVLSRQDAAARLEQILIGRLVRRIVRAVGEQDIEPEIVAEGRSDDGASTSATETSPRARRRPASGCTARSCSTRTRS